MIGKLYLRNHAQAILWIEELSGQISDGMWENSTPNGHWEPWCDAEVVIDPSQPGRTFYAQKDSYLFTSSDLLSIVGDQMLEYVRDASKRDCATTKAMPAMPSYTEADMLRDLRDLRKIIKIVVPEHDTDPIAALPAHFEGDPFKGMPGADEPKHITGVQVISDDEQTSVSIPIHPPCSCQVLANAHHAVLPTGTKMDLGGNPGDAEYFDAGQTALYLVPVEGAKAPMIATTFGTTDGFETGTTHSFRHDQSGQFWGTYRVAGWQVFASGIAAGELPAPGKRIRHLVFK